MKWLNSATIVWIQKMFWDVVKIESSGGLSQTQICALKKKLSKNLSTTCELKYIWSIWT